MNTSDSFLQAVQWADVVSFRVEQMPRCRKGHLLCWRVKVEAVFTTPQGTLRRPLGPFEHLTMETGLDVVASVSAHYGTLLEALRLQEQREDTQLVLDLDHAVAAD